jgi:general secretion pathway protein B
MSSILDALKKSEAERQRGVPPTLGSPAGIHGTRPAPRRSSRLLLPALAVVALGVAWSAGLFDFGGDAPQEAVDAADPPNDAADAQALAVQEAQTAADSPVTTPSTTSPPVESLPPGGSGEGNTPRRISFGSRYTPEARARAAQIAAEMHGDAGAQSGTSATAPPQPEAPAANAQAGAPVTPDPGPRAEPEAAPAAPAAGASPAPATPAVAEAPAAAPAPAPALQPEVAPAGGGVPTLYELPFAARRSLPEVAVTMHMYSADPGRRFALVNGTRVQDGETLEGGLEVVRILPEGVQLRFEGTDFVLPVGN